MSEELELQSIFVNIPQSYLHKVTIQYLSFLFQRETKMTRQNHVRTSPPLLRSMLEGEQCTDCGCQAFDWWHPQLLNRRIFCVEDYTDVFAQKSESKKNYFLNWHKPLTSEQRVLSSMLMTTNKTQILNYGWKEHWI